MLMTRHADRLIALLPARFWAAGLVLLAVQPTVAQGPVQATRAQDPPASSMHDVITEEALLKQVESASKLDTTLSARTRPVGEARPSSGNSLLTSSIILFDGEKFTLVPVGSILNLPAAHRQKIVEEPKGEFTFWPSFLERNASWLRAREVPLKMAKGDSKAAEAVLKETSKDTHVVVSVYKTGPISILEPEVAEKKDTPQR